MNTSPMFCFIPTHVKVLRMYVDPIQSQNTPNAAGLDLRGGNIGAISMTGGSLANTHGEQCQPTAQQSIFEICIPSRQTNLVNAKFLGVDFSGSNWSNALMSGVNFTGSTFWNAIFRGTDFSNSTLTNVAIHWTDFTGANFTGAKGLDTLQDDAPGGSIFCNATMPDGKICSSDTIWNGKIDCRCPVSN